MKKSTLILLSIVLLTSQTAFIAARSRSSDYLQPASTASWIAFVAPDGSLNLIHPDGSELTQIAASVSSKGRNYSSLKWSPDGERLAYSEKVWLPEDSPIYVYTLGDSSPQKIIDHSFGGFDWYPDGSALIYDKYAEREEVPNPLATCYGDYLTSGQYPKDGLYKYDFYTGESTLVIPAPSITPLFKPDISPDGKHVFFQQHEFDGLYAYFNAYPQYVASFNSPNQVHELVGTLSDCRWSPDSQEIACGAWNDTCSGAESCPVTLFNPQGQVLETLPNQNLLFDTSPLWSPAGDELVFNSTQNRYFADGPCGGGSGPSTGETIELYSFTTGERRAITQGIPLDWSPDGNSLLMLTGSPMFGTSKIFITDESGSAPVYLADGFEAAWQPSATLPPVTDLVIRPAEDSGQHGYNILIWTVPTPNAGSTRSAAEYDVRFSSSPISEATWDSASQLDGEPFPASAGTQERWTTSDARLRDNQLWYFALKVRSQDGGWSPVSNSPAYIDSGFRTNLDGFNFRNGPLCNPEATGWERYPDPPAGQDFTEVDALRMLGASACLIPSLNGTGCSVYLPTIRLWVDWVNSFTTVGHCLGMSVTSLNLFTQPSLIQLPNPGWQTVYQDVPLADARREITYYWIEQLTNPVYGKRTFYLSRPSPSQVLNEVLSGLQPRGDPVELDLFLDGNWHSVLPTALTEKSPGVWYIHVYDSNCPGTTDDWCTAAQPPDCRSLSYVTIDTQNKTWQYHDFISSNTLINPIIATPLSLFNGPQSLPFLQNFVVLVQAIPDLVAIQDEQGHITGTLAGETINEIPGAGASPVSGGITAIEPVYSLPLGSEYTTTLDGSSLSNQEPVAVAQFGPDFAASVEDTQLYPGAQDQMKVHPDGTVLTYTSGSDKEATLTLAMDGDAQGSQFTVRGADLEGGSSVSLVQDLAAGRYTFSNLSSQPSEYQVELTRANEDGEQVFTHQSIAYATGETHTFDLSEWDGEGKLTLEIDQDGDGEPERQVKLKNNEAGLPGASANLPALFGGIFLVLFGIAACVFAVMRLARPKPVK